MPCGFRLPSSKRSGFQEGDEIEITVAGTRRFEIERDDSRANALARLKGLRRPLPKGFRFDRDEANERLQLPRHQLLIR